MYTQYVFSHMGTTQQLKSFINNWCNKAPFRAWSWWFLNTWTLSGQALEDQLGAWYTVYRRVKQHVKLNMRNLRQIIYDRFSQLSKMTRDFVSLNFCTQLHHILYSNQMFPKCCFILAGIDTAPHGYLLGEGMKPMLKASWILLSPQMWWYKVCQSIE